MQVTIEVFPLCYAVVSDSTKLVEYHEHLAYLSSITRERCTDETRIEQLTHALLSEASWVTLRVVLVVQGGIARTRHTDISFCLSTESLQFCLQHGYLCFEFLRALLVTTVHEIGNGVRIALRVLRSHLCFSRSTDEHLQSPVLYGEGVGYAYSASHGGG